MQFENNSSIQTSQRNESQPGSSRINANYPKVEVSLEKAATKRKLSRKTRNQQKQNEANNLSTILKPHVQKKMIMNMFMAFGSKTMKK